MMHGMLTQIGTTMLRFSVLKHIGVDDEFQVLTD